MLAVMATTFIMLVRVDARLTASYADDLRCEMLVRGALSYFKALLRDDLDRTWGKYENRDTIVPKAGWRSYTSKGTQAPGELTLQYGTPMCNDFWFNAPQQGWGGIFARDVRGPTFGQQSFGASWGHSRGIVGRYYDKVNNREFDAWLSRSVSGPSQRPSCPRTA